ncbi:MAG: hypothetical protein OEW64_11980 [Gammaproteobacteria bacterium]|nr:hypothetical protein [Gammaproteobacteria bacterium]MDH5304798.1 hypothetical protein [Gammaproteobacteria bacterium]MDH5322693.1 hypothetical protein [Gammaproteobacteria bacterium]
MPDSRPRSARLQLTLIALVFFGPLLLAVWLYFGGHFELARRGSNHGALLQPIVNLREALSESGLLLQGEGRWMLLYVHESECSAACRDALYTLRQSRLMLGKDQDRLVRGFLHGDTPPDTVFLAAEHQGLVAAQEVRLVTLLNNKKPNELAAGGYFLLDPLGNLVMYFRPDIDPSEMVSDIEHLLRLSHIG